MTRFVLAAATGALLAAAAATPAAGQDYRYAAGYNAGAAWFSTMNDGAGGGPERIELDAGWIVGLQFEQWHGTGRVGTRLNAAFTQRPLNAPGRNPAIDTWLADAGVMLRALPASPHTVFNPYLGVGAGFVHYALGRGDFIHFNEAGAVYPGRSRAILAGVGFAGADIITSLRWDGQPVGVRIEAANHVARRSPFEPAGGGTFSPIHNVRIVLGIFSGFGALR